MLKHQTKAVLSTVVAVLALAACNKPTQETTVQQDAPQPASSPAKEASGKLPANAPVYLVGTISSFPPFVMRDELGGAYGFDMDVMTAIGEQQGFGVKFIIAPWKGTLEMLNTGERDIIATGVVITPERQEIYDFSDPYLDTQWMAVLKEDAAAGKPRYKTFEEAMANSKKFVTQGGAAGVPVLKKALQGRVGEVQEVDSQFMEIKAVINGQADVAYDISRVLQYYTHTLGAEQKLYGLIDPNSEVNHFGYVVKKGRTDDLLPKINAGLKAIKQNGTYQKIYEKWYGKDTPQ